jgi:hypothetical protein
MLAPFTSTVSDGIGIAEACDVKGSDPNNVIIQIVAVGPREMRADSPYCNAVSATDAVDGFLHIDLGCC